MQLTHSETMLLTAERYAPAGGLRSSNIKLLHNGVKVDAVVLSCALLCAALLDCEARGAVQLEVDHTHEKVLFGLFGRREVATLYASPGNPHDYQLGSIEARLCDLVRGGEIKVMDLVHALLGKDAHEPWSLTPGLVEDGLIRRNLLRKDAEKHLLWTTQAVHVPNSTLAQLRVEVDLQIAQLFDSAKQHRPQLWSLLNEAIRAAHSARRKWDDSFSER